MDKNARICGNCGVRIQPVGKKCPYCGNNENEENAVYCGNCGRRIDKGNRKIIIGIVAVILVIAAAAALLIALRLRTGGKRIIPEEPAVAESAVTEQAAETSWTENILMSDEVANYIVYNGYGTFVMGSSVPRAQINSITFLDTLKDVPADSWDVSEKQDGSVLAWIMNGNTLYVGANGGINAKYCQSLFYGYYNVLEINFNHCFHTDYATSMKSMFDYCPALRALDVSDFSTENVTDMAGMFYQCSSLTSLDLNGFNTSRVTDMSNMFAHCDGLTNLDLSHFDTGNVVNHDGFMESDKMVNGHPWEELFLLQKNQSNSAVGSHMEPVKEIQFHYYDYSEEAGGQYAEIVGLDAKNHTQWTYTSGIYDPGTQAPAISEMAYEGDRYYFCEDGAIIALDAATGKVIWRNWDFHGACPYSCFGEDGTIYACGNLGPDFFAVSADGQTLCKIEDFNGEYYYPEKIRKVGNRIEVTMDIGPDYKEQKDYVFTVDPADFSYKLQGSVPESW